MNKPALTLLLSLAASPALAQDAVAPAPTPAESPPAAVPAPSPTPEPAAAPAVAPAEAAPVAAPAESAAVPPPSAPLAIATTPPDAGADESPALPEATWRPYGYLRTVFSAIMEDGKGPDYVGKNDGFQMANARLGVEVTRGRTRAVISADGAVDRRDELNSSQGDVEVRLRDAFAEYTVCSGFKVAAGQFEPPYDAEELTSNTELVFVDQAVESRGVKGVEGWNLQGLSLEREVGLLLSTGDVYFTEGDEGPGMSAAFALTNGSSAKHPVNDNDALAYTGRLEFLWGRIVRAGVAANVNAVSTNVPPDQVTDDRFGLAADLRVDFMGAHVLGQFMRRTSASQDVAAEPEVIAQGFHVQGAYDAPFGLTPGYRYAQYDPTAEVQVEDAVTAANYEHDEIKVHTFGLSWRVPEEPLTLKANYHVMLEDEARKLANDRFDFLVQGEF
jgi:hypothetical protein